MAQIAIMAQISWPSYGPVGVLFMAQIATLRGPLCALRGPLRALVRALRDVWMDRDVGKVTSH